MIRRASRALSATALGVALLVGGASAAAAHDELTGTSPADGATVAAAPGQVSLTFSEAVLRVGDHVVVTGPDGDATDGPLTIDGAVLTQPLRAALPAGAYTVTWRAASDDGHPVSGTFAFTVGAAGAAPAASGTPSSTPSGSASPVAAPASRQPVDHTARDVGIGALVVLVAALVVALRRRRS